MPEKTVYQELKDILKQFEDFIGNEQNFNLVKTGIDALRAIGDPVKGQVNDLLSLLIDLLTKLNTEINKLDVSNIPGISQATDFVGKAKTFLETAKTLLPGEADTIEEAIRAADFAAGLPSLNDLKTEILRLIAFLLGKLGTLRGSA